MLLYFVSALISCEMCLCGTAERLPLQCSRYISYSGITGKHQLCDIVIAPSMRMSIKHYSRRCATMCATEQEIVEKLVIDEAGSGRKHVMPG